MAIRYFQIIYILFVSLGLLQGCLYSDKPLANRETVSAKSPLVGYWKSPAATPDQDPIILSIFYIGQPDYLFVIASPEKTYKQDEIEDATVETDADLDIYEAFLSRHNEKSYASLKEYSRKNKNHYEIIKYGLTGDGVLSIQIFNWDKLSEIVKKSNFTPAQYDSNNGVFTMEGPDLMAFVSSLNDDVLNPPVIFQRIDPVIQSKSK